MTKTINISEARKQSPELLGLALAGTEVIIVAGDKPLAKPTPLDDVAQKRVAGLDDGAVWMSDDFDDPLPDEFWTGESAAPRAGEKRYEPMDDRAQALLFWRYIASSLDRLVAVLDGLAVDDLSWRPPAAEANSLYALVVHTLGNAEENLLETLGGQPIGRDRAGEFAAQGDLATVTARWHALRTRLAETLTTLPIGALDATYQHPRRGPISGRDILIVVARHAAEHLGQAELTRDLLRTARAAGA